MSPTLYKNFIGGAWAPAASGKTLLNLNPADHADVIGEFPASGAADVDAAVAAAKKAFCSWRLVPAPKRAEILLRTGTLLKERKEKYARAMTRRWAKCWRKRAATCRRRSTKRFTWPARDAGSMA